jgi:hypothetical protein
MENKNRNPWIAIIPAMVTIMLNSLFLWGVESQQLVFVELLFPCRQLLTSLLD